MQSLTEIKKEKKKQNPKTKSETISMLAKEELEEQIQNQINEYKQTIEHIPTDIITKELIDRLCDDYVFTNPFHWYDWPDDELRELLQTIDSAVVPALDKVWLIEKVKRAGIQQKVKRMG